MSGLFYKSKYLLKTISKCMQCLNSRRFVSEKYYKRLGQLRTMKLESPSFSSILTPELKILVNIFSNYNYELRIAGGAVRDLLLDKVPHDIDFATTATPAQMKEIFDKENIRMFNTAGEKHGTVTVRVNDKENFEITTLRIDVVTDGRRAEVEFTKDWQLDANRRDLTVNAMFLGFDGTVFDYFNGVEDLKNRKVTFVGDPVCRIQEDYLRILRYFRFYGRIAEKPYDHEESTLVAIKENASGLSRVSGERIWMELKKILCGNHAEAILPTMLKLGIGTYMGFPENCNIEEYSNVCKLTEGLDPSANTRLTGLFHDSNQIYTLNERLKLSNDEFMLMAFLIEHRRDSFDNDSFKYCQFLMCDCPGEKKKLRERIYELLKYRGEKELLDKFSNWTFPKFPVTGYDLLDKNIPKGPVYHGIMQELQQIWKLSMFTSSKEEILTHLDDIIDKVTATVPATSNKKKTAAVPVKKKIKKTESM